MVLRLLSAGTDSLYLSFSGKLELELLERMEELKQEAQHSGEPAPISFEDGLPTVVKPVGWGFFPYWVHCSDFELHLSDGVHVPPVYVRLSSLFLHSVGVVVAVETVRRFVETSLMRPHQSPSASRIDIYADFQGWQPTIGDFDRFVTRSISNHAYYEPVQASQSGQRLSGFRFGKDHLVARLYDKSLEITKSGKDWMRDCWNGLYREQEPVWRLEFQYRREAIAEFNLRDVDEVLACRQDFWKYGVRWLSLRDQTEEQHRSHWPVAPVWVQLGDASMGTAVAGVIRRRVRERQELVLVRGLTGYLTSLAALLDVRDFDRAVTVAAGRVRGHLEREGRPFAKIVAGKRLRQV